MSVKLMFVLGLELDRSTLVLGVPMINFVGEEEEDKGRKKS